MDSWAVLNVDMLLSSIAIVFQPFQPFCSRQSLLLPSSASWQCLQCSNEEQSSKHAHEAETTVAACEALPLTINLVRCVSLQSRVHHVCATGGGDGADHRLAVQRAAADRGSRAQLLWRLLPLHDVPIHGRHARDGHHLRQQAVRTLSLFYLCCLHREHQGFFCRCRLQNRLRKSSAHQAVCLCCKLSANTCASLISMIKRFRPVFKPIVS